MVPPCQPEHTVTQSHPVLRLSLPPAPSHTPPSSQATLPVTNWAHHALSNLHAVSDYSIFPILCMAIPMHPATSASNVHSSGKPSVTHAGRIHWSSCPRSDSWLPPSVGLLMGNPHALFTSVFFFHSEVLYQKDGISTAVASQPNTAMAAVVTDLDATESLWAGQDGWGFLPRNVLFWLWQRKTLPLCRPCLFLGFFLCTLALSPTKRNNSPVSHRAIDSDKNSPFRQWVHLFLSHSLPQTAGSLYEENVVSLRSHTLRSL